MSERVLLADRRGDGHYDQFRARWANTDALFRAMADGKPLRTPQTGSWESCGHGRWAEILDGLSYLTLDLCIECIDPNVTAYLPVWAGIPTGEKDSTPPNCGTLLEVGSRREYESLRRQIRQQKASLGQAIERGDIDTETAHRRLLAGCRPRNTAPSARHLLDDPGGVSG